jgi:hypothetical protein
MRYFLFCIDCLPQYPVKRQLNPLATFRRLCKVADDEMEEDKEGYNTVVNQTWFVTSISNSTALSTERNCDRWVYMI